VRFAGLAPVRSIAICGILVGSGLLTTLLFPFSLFVAALIQIALTQYVVCFLATAPVQRYITEPYEAAKGAGDLID
jgi:hypothetical protein